MSKVMMTGRPMSATLFLCLVASLSVFSTDSRTCYVLGPRDQISVKVFWHDDLCVTTEISTNGTITYPLLGSVQAEGLCARQLEQAIKEALEKDYLQTAEVAVSVTQRRSKSVTVLGKVARPGKIALPGPSRLLDVISLAGGVTSPAVRKILLMKTADSLSNSENGGNWKHHDPQLINSKRLLEEADLSLNVAVEDGDFIYVIDPSAGKFYITGEVARPGAYDVTDNLTMMKAITLAGVPTKVASLRAIYVKRIEGGEEEKTRVELNTLVKEDDIVVVPESLF